MAEPLKNSFGPDIPTAIAASLQQVQPEFDTAEFLTQCLDGFEELELTPRARRIAACMADHLPVDRGRAVRLVTASLAHSELDEANGSMAGFFFMPHGYFVADCGLEHFEDSMVALREITERFTSEFSIRPFLVAHPERTLAQLHAWVEHPSEHVRRLVSEGTRPRLPWASRLAAFQDDPGPVLELLEQLKDDESEYVRRSVANNLNDIAKDHPDLVISVANGWWTGGSPDRRRLVRHGLRTLIKQGNPAALAVMGFSPDSAAELGDAQVDPHNAQIGGKVTVEVDIVNPSAAEAGALVDLRVHFVKANGMTSPKVFKGAELWLAPGEQATVRKTVSLKQHSTRTHYPGKHAVDVVINGVASPAGTFVLEASSAV